MANTHNSKAKLGQKNQKNEGKFIKQGLLLETECYLLIGTGIL